MQMYTTTVPNVVDFFRDQVGKWTTQNCGFCEESFKWIKKKFAE